MIGDQISRGQYVSGNSLPEVALAAQLGVSRGTVREALRLLTEDGLVEVVPHRGVFVTDVTPRRLQEVIALRMLLEPYAARLAVEGDELQRHGLAEVREALDNLRLVTSGPDDAAAFVDADLRLHETISRYCGNDTLLSILGFIRAQVRRYMFWGHLYDQSDVNVEYEHHRKLVEVVASGDAGAAEVAARQHVERAGRILMTRLQTRDLGSANPPRVPRRRARKPSTVTRRPRSSKVSGAIR